AIEAERSQVDQVETENLENSSDGKIFAPKMIIQMLPTILEKLPITILMTVVAAIIGVTLGFLIAVIKINNIRVLTQIFIVFVFFIRGTPQLFLLFLSFYVFPLVVQCLNKQFGCSIVVNGMPALLYVVIAFGLNEAAYTSRT